MTACREIQTRIPLVPVHTVEVPGFTLVIADLDEVRAMAKEHGCENWERVRGFCKADEKYIVVARQEDGKPLPDFEVLGHEVCHIIFDRFHK